MLLAHTLVEGPLMDVGAVGTVVNANTDRVNAALVPHGPTARTLKLPVLYVVLKLSVILFVVELPVAPVGKVH